MKVLCTDQDYLTPSCKHCGWAQANINHNINRVGGIDVLFLCSQSPCSTKTTIGNSRFAGRRRLPGHTNIITHCDIQKCTCASLCSSMNQQITLRTNMSALPFWTLYHMPVTWSWLAVLPHASSMIRTSYVFTWFHQLWKVLEASGTHIDDRWKIIATCKYESFSIKLTRVTGDKLCQCMFPTPTFSHHSSKHYTHILHCIINKTQPSLLAPCILIFLFSYLQSTTQWPMFEHSSYCIQHCTTCAWYC